MLLLLILIIHSFSFIHSFIHSFIQAASAELVTWPPSPFGIGDSVPPTGIKAVFILEHRLTDSHNL